MPAATQLVLAVCASHAALTAGFAPAAARQPLLAQRGPAPMGVTSLVPRDIVGIEPAPYTDAVSAAHPLHVVIAGAGVGGLALANAFVGQPHVKVTVLEKTSKFKRFGGPIQLASNAMQVRAVAHTHAPRARTSDPLSKCTARPLNPVPAKPWF
jgi:hypothetical protein